MEHQLPCAIRHKLINQLRIGTLYIFGEHLRIPFPTMRRPLIRQHLPLLGRRDIQHHLRLQIRLIEDRQHPIRTICLKLRVNVLFLIDIDETLAALPVIIVHRLELHDDIIEAFVKGVLGQRYEALIEVDDALLVFVDDEQADLFAGVVQEQIFAGVSHLEVGLGDAFVALFAQFQVEGVEDGLPFQLVEPLLSGFVS